MKVHIGAHKGWFGPYQLAEKLCFWVKDEKDEFRLSRKPAWVHKFGEWLAYGNVESEPEVGEVRSWDRTRDTTLLYKFLIWVSDQRTRTVKVHIDPWDTWNMDDTLAYIVLPMLKQLQATKHGAPYVDFEDVPDELHGTPLTQEQKDSGETDDKHFERWDWVMDEMIFAFDSKINGNWEAQFESGENDIQWKTLEDGMTEIVRGPNDTKEYDWEGRKAYQKRISNGFRLFGKYYESLWD